MNTEMLTGNLAAANALMVHEEAAAEFARRFGRRYALVEDYRLDGAEDVLVMSNAYASQGKAAVDAARARGRRVGLLRLRVIRPWPAAEIAHLLRGRRTVAVLDQNLAPGLGGILFQEVAASLYHEPFRPRALCSFIGGLGGKDISDAEFEAVFDRMANAGERREGMGPVLLYTEGERRDMENLMDLAGNPRPEGPRP